MSSSYSEPIRHGGDLSAAVREFGGTQRDWLDLSTGISPWAYPIPAIEPETWRQLPPPPDKLLYAASQYYGCSVKSLIATPGSQFTIRIIPRLLDRPTTVAVPMIGYQEHWHSWNAAGHAVLRYDGIAELQQLIADKDVKNAVIINPNNPTGDVIDRTSVLNIAEALEGTLIVDEAFADVDESSSVCRYVAQGSEYSNIIVLRSLGKFFGLAGARIGFAITTNQIGHALNALLSPWSLNSAAQSIAETALLDQDWQFLQRQRIIKQAEWLTTLLAQNLSPQTTVKLASQGLFATIVASHAGVSNMHSQLAEQHIWTRLGDPINARNWLRLSLPGRHQSRLAAAFKQISFNSLEEL